MSQSLETFGIAVDATEFRSNILNTHHAIHYYAYEYWLEHMLASVSTKAILPDEISTSIAIQLQRLLLAQKPIGVIDARLLAPDLPSDTRSFAHDLPYRKDVVEMIRLLLSFYDIARKSSPDHENLEGQSFSLSIISSVSKVALKARREAQKAAQDERKQRKRERRWASI